MEGQEDWTSSAAAVCLPWEYCELFAAKEVQTGLAEREEQPEREETVDQEDWTWEPAWRWREG